MTMMDSLEVLASCDLEFGLYSKLKVKVGSVIFFIRYCMFCAYTRPRYQVRIYRTIGPRIEIVLQLFSATAIPRQLDEHISLIK